MNISVIIPVYNAEKYITRAVESALQFDEVKEILLIEDASPDDSLTICKNLESTHHRVKTLQHPDLGNHGAGASRNLGIENASQEFIAFLDADDYYLPNRFDAERVLFKNTTIEGVFGAIGTDFISEKGKIEFQKKFKDIQLSTVNYPAEGKDIFFGLMGLTEKKFGTFFSLIALTIRKATLDKTKLRFNHLLRVHQDSDFIIKLSFLSHLKTGIIDQAVSNRGVHDDNRITKIELYSQKYNERQFLLWDSLYKWAIETEGLDPNIQEEIRLRKTAHQLATLNGSKKIFSVFTELIKNPKILKTRYRFLYFKK